MPPAARATRTSAQIRAEIEQTFGFLPPFFEPALPTPQVLESLWQQTLTAYLDSPLPALFKERLNASLSRFCAVPYCMVCHSAALRPLGMTAAQVLALLESPPPLEPGAGRPLADLGERPIGLSDFPAADSPREEALLACATTVFLEESGAGQCRERLAQVLGPELFNSLGLYLAYIKTCHLWMEMHPEVSYEADKRVQDNLGPLLAEEPALADFFRDYQEKVRSQRLGREERAAAAGALRSAQAYTARILETIPDAFYAFDSEWRFTYVNAQAERLLQRPRAGLLGRNVWEEFPESVGTAPDWQYHRAAAQGTDVSFEEFYVPLATWFEVRAYPSEGGLSVFFQDITERKRAEEALRASEERYRLLVEGARDYAMILLDAAGRVTGWNAGAERILGWGAGEVLGSLTDVIWTPEDQEEGVPARELARAESEGRAMDLRWHLKKDGSAFYADGILEALRGEDGRLRGYAKVLRDATDRKALEDERARLADVNRLLLESTGEGIYGVDGEGRFAFVNRAAARMLGHTQEQMLGRNSHALVHYARPDGTAYPEEECPIHRAVRSGESADVEDDVFWRTDGTSFPVAYRTAPLRGGGLGAGAARGAVVTFSDISERRALDAERERLADRERNIARQLQAALTPAVPARVPGMALAKYYEASMDEAGVGGDFYDVFPLNGESRTALVVGDLMGKGLAAASQVATVRNMLRYALYRAPTLAGALSSLNALLSEQGLLTGFATLFVGAYDGGAGTLTYINCGQEPALIRRAGSGRVEPLDPTGPVMGAFRDAQFTARAVSMGPGDALAVFTDGLTEVGGSRTEMIGVEGVSELLALPAPPGLAGAAGWAEYLALTLIAGVDAAAAGGVTRDDVCLLVGVVE